MAFTLLPFHANLIQAAISADAPVVPAALRFVDPLSGQISLAPSYIGDEIARRLAVAHPARAGDHGAW
jgi:hypothetical protein